MNIEELKEERKKLEMHLANLINNELNSFRERTGISPHYLDVTMVNSTEIGELAKRYIVSDVKVGIEI